MKSVIIYAMPLLLGASAYSLYTDLSIILSRFLEEKAGAIDSGYLYSTYDYNQKCFRNYSVFFFVESIIIWILFLLLEILKNWDFTETISKIIATGIHIPLLFFISSGLIKVSSMLLLKRYDVSRKEIGESIYVIVASFSIIWLLFDWEMGLIILAILIGKSIWIDGSLTQIKKVYVKIFKYLRGDIDNQSVGMVTLFGKKMIKFGVLILLGLLFLTFIMHIT